MRKREVFDEDSDKNHPQKALLKLKTLEWIILLQQFVEPECLFSLWSHEVNEWQDKPSTQMKKKM